MMRAQPGRSVSAARPGVPGGGRPGPRGVRTRQEAQHCCAGKGVNPMANRSNRTLARVGTGLAIAAIVFGACSSRSGETTAPSTDAGASASTAAGGGAKGTVNIAINPWVGYEADAAVVGYLLKNKLGYTVEEKNLKEEISWLGFESGDVDVV